MKISFEIVPRSLQSFAEQYQFVQSLGSAIDIINVPDIQRFPVRSWELATKIDQLKYRFIPHFRAIDFKQDGVELSRIIENYALQRLLLVTGDPPEGLQRQFFRTNVLELISVIKRRFPSLEIYAGFDPHRHGLQDECHYIQRKIEAGVCGFFSQPFFDSRLIDIYAEHLCGVETFIGISPITSSASQQYWEVKNKVKFPANFQPEYQWNIDFANTVIKSAKQQGYNIYFMPIKLDLAKYFSGICFD